MPSATTMMQLFWIAICAAALLTPRLPLLNKAFSYGKIARDSNYWFTAGQAFTSFYLIAFVFNGVMLMMAYTFVFSQSEPSLSLLWSKIELGGGNNDIVSTLFVAIVFQCHVFRRFCECLFVHKFSGSTMTLYVHASGVAYYVAVSLSIFIDSPIFESNSMSRGRALWNQWRMQPRHVIGFVVFVVGSVVQWQCHRTLSALRDLPKKGTSHHNSNKKVYRLPRGGAFEYLACPHYTAEIVLYVGLAIIAGTDHHTSWLIVAWCVCNLGVTAQKTDRWYAQMFPAYVGMRRRVLIPGLW